MSENSLHLGYFNVKYISFVIKYAVYLFFTRGWVCSTGLWFVFPQWWSVAVEVEVGLGWGEVLSPAVCSADGASEGLDDRLEPQPLTDPRLCRPGAQDKAPFQHSLSFPLNFPPSLWSSHLQELGKNGIHNYHDFHYNFHHALSDG